jgi:hypothetical protein
MKILSLTVAVALGLAGCAAPTLDQKLTGKSGQERMKTLYHECIQRANYHPPGGHGKDYRGHEARQWKICDSMYEATKEGKNTNAKRTALAEECGIEINKGLKTDNAANVRHFQRIQRICQEMTGQPVSLNTKPK